MAISLVENSNQRNRFGFMLLMLYLLFEYGRPQGLIPVLGFLRLGIVLIGLMGLYLVATRNVRFESVQSKCILGFLILSAIHVPIAVNNYWAFQGAKGFLIYLVISLSIIAFVNSYERLIRFVNLWIGINVVCAVIGAKHGGMVPGSAFMGDENDFALAMNMVIPFAYFMFLSADSKKKKTLYLAACGLFIASGVTSHSRGGFIGLTIVLLYCWYKTPKKLLATVIVAIIIGAMYFTAPATYWDRVKSIKEENIKTGTGEERWYSWKIGWRMFVEHPIIGVGPGNYPWHVAQYQPEEDWLYNYRRSLAGRAAHSLYFTLFPEFGLTGALLFGCMLINMLKGKKQIREFDRKLKDYFLIKRGELSSDSVLIIKKLEILKFILFGVQGALLGYLISGIFISVFYYPHFWILAGLSVALRDTVEILDGGENFDTAKKWRN